MTNTSKSIKVSGRSRKLDSISELEQEYRNWFDIQRKGGFILSTERGAGIEEIPDVEADDVLEILLDDDVTLFSRRDDFERDFPSTMSRDGAAKVLRFQSIDLGPPSRGVKEWFIKLLDVFQADIADNAGLALCRKFEQKSVAAPGLYQIEPTDELKLTPASFPDKHDTSKPVVVFIHGTASSTAGSFGGLWGESNNDLRSQLTEHYHGQVYTLEHWSLSESPIKNAIDLVEALPKKSMLHLISHSRGGIVGELVCRYMVGAGNPFQQADFENYKDRAKHIADQLDEGKAQANEAYKQQLEELKTLNDLLISKEIRVEKFVRVACPARGTTLASARLDRWLSVFFNVVGLVPAVRATPYYTLLKNFIRALVKTRTKAELLPGLEAQMPGSPIIALLNDSERVLSSDLSVIAGDIEREGILGQIALLLPDQFFDSEHDLVVNTPSMYGGSERKKGERFYFVQGNGVSHFNYFRNRETALRVVNGLLLNEDALDPYFTCQLPEVDEPIARSSRDTVPGTRPIIFLLPGIMGSELDVRRTTIWAKKFKLAFGGLSKLKIARKYISSSGLIADTYSNLFEYLSRENDVIPFHYDWRTSMEEAAENLANAIKATAEQAARHDQPVSIVAHSMGGLLARLMMTRHPDAWEAMLKHADSRLLMLGTPNGGSFSIPRMLFGHDKLVKGLALLDVTNSHAEILDIIRNYPGVLVLLPFGDEQYDFFDPDTWDKLAKTDSEQFAPPLKTKLAEAARIRTLINTRPLALEQPGKVLYVAGRADETPVALSLENNRAVFKGTSQGDGRVPWATGIPTGIPCWYMDAVHGDLLNHSPAFEAIKELVRTGHTELLPSQRPSRARGVPTLFDMKPDEVDVYPDDKDIHAWAMGSGKALSRLLKPTTKRIKLKITHGNLAFSRYPVMVGHYQSDGLFSAEQYLDHCLDGQLSRCRGLGLYPGEINSAELILNRKGGKPAGALIVGLGSVGELSMSRLSQTFANALQRYAFDIDSARRKKDTYSDNTAPITISSLLIGSSSGGLPLHDALAAMMLGAKIANQALRELYPDSRLGIDEIQIIELLESKAILAARAADDLFSTNSELAALFDYDPHLELVKGGESSAFCEEEAGWWERLQIVQLIDGSLSFNSITNRARTEKRLLATDRKKVDHFLREATASTWGDRLLPKTLFEMLMPNEIKDASDKQKNTILLVDEKSARYPWELLEDRLSYGQKPLAVQSRLIRQLASEQFRHEPKMSPGNRALVIGEPHLNNRKLWAELSGAAEEAEQAAHILSNEGQFYVKKLINTDSAGILKGLHQHSYRILHLAGHGVHNFNLKRALEKIGMHEQAAEAEESVSGMVIGDNIFLNAADVSQIRRVPELVFINCCHLGDTIPEEQRANFPDLAANLAVAFIRMGARAVIAAGWAVDDAAAKTFSDVFYNRMIHGKDFGEAVHRARKAIFDEHQQVNTWGAYQCYGDPQYKLANHRSSSAPRPQAPKTPRDLILRLEAIRERAAVATDAYLKILVKQLESYLDESRNKALKTWWQRGDVCAAIGSVYRELDRFDEALDWYRKAAACEDATLSVKIYEQFANTLVRRAAAVACDARTKKLFKDAEKSIQEALDILSKIDDLSFDIHKNTRKTTFERECLRGYSYKRLALIYRLKDEGYKTISKALDSMQEHYRNADHIYLAENSDHNYYPYTNCLVAKVLRNLMQGKFIGLTAEEVKALEKIQSDHFKKDQAEPGFWSLISDIESELLTRIADNTLADYADGLANRYLAAKKRGASPRELRSVRENLDFLINIIDVNTGTDASRDRRTTINNALIEINEKIGGTAKGDRSAGSSLSVLSS